MRAKRKITEKYDRELSKRSKHGGSSLLVTAGDCSEPLKERAHAASALGALRDDAQLQNLRNLYTFLASAHLHHCVNCDEEWPVFDQPFPQAGVEFAGPLAGKCETITAAGFLQSHQDENLCSRCSSKGAYGKMFSEQNGMHLGPRHAALTELTWYESLLIARVHPMVSVLTLAATGQLVYAAHVVNYHQKVLEWVSELPALLNDKGCFLIKRRKCMTNTPSVARQKKPMTANRQRASLQQSSSVG